MATGLVLAVVGAIAFSAKAIIVKLAYRHGPLRDALEDLAPGRVTQRRQTGTSRFVVSHDLR